MKETIYRDAAFVSRPRGSFQRLDVDLLQTGRPRPRLADLHAPTHRQLLKN